MSKFNSLNPYRLSVEDRIMEINGPEIAELYRWHKALRKIDDLMAEESQGVIETLERGPIFDHHETLLVTVKEIKHMQNWHKSVKPTPSETVDKIVAALEAALYGKRRPDLQAIADAEKAEADAKKAASEAGKSSESKDDKK